MTGFKIESILLEMVLGAYHDKFKVAKKDTVHMNFPQGFNAHWVESDF